ncbi:MAG: hypothetical protein ACOCU7_05615 [Tangfeifania sp.]
MANSENITIPKAEYQELLKKVSEIDLLKHQLAELRRLIYGQKRERFVSPDPNQGVLFDFQEEGAPETKKEEITYTQRQCRGISNCTYFGK